MHKKAWRSGRVADCCPVGRRFAPRMLHAFQTFQLLRKMSEKFDIYSKIFYKDVEKFVRYLCLLVLRHQMRVSNYFVNSFYSVVPIDCSNQAQYSTQIATGQYLIITPYEGCEKTAYFPTNIFISKFAQNSYFTSNMCFFCSCGISCSDF